MFKPFSSMSRFGKVQFSGIGAWWSATGAQNPEMTRIQIEGDPTTSVVCQARVDGITGLVADLKSVAAGLVSINSEGLTEARPVTKDFNLAVKRYNTTVKAGMTAHITNQQPHHAQELQKFTTAAKTQGWITAGQIYWAALNIRNQVHEELRKVPQVRTLSQNLISATTNERQLGEYLDLVSHFVTSTRRDRANAAGQLLDDVPDPTDPGDDPDAGLARKPRKRTGPWTRPARRSRRPPKKTICSKRLLRTTNRPTWSGTRARDLRWSRVVYGKP